MQGCISYNAAVGTVVVVLLMCYRSRTQECDKTKVAKGGNGTQKLMDEGGICSVSAM